MAKKKCPRISTEHIVHYCDGEECADWNVEVGECDPFHWGVLLTYLEGLGDLFECQ